ncbi:hypothetical protein [Streptomyces beihaiensis]|uniref:Serine/threonine protein kinase n=1 Tax=Streptomyces beihaiensis TaxID=2984495 RepID=A0ABT3TQ06_9ACTN|nr:hypothetical protein [Streptomyces beihaiensis]MCX3059109.1 hypothetical protein [Streptomyces beihaiensis]
MDDAQEEPVVQEPPVRRRRTGLLISCAAVLGVVAGVCTGYVVQAGRAPDPLPPLAQETVAQAKGGPAHEVAAATGDRRVRTDGDLRKLLVPRPSGAQTADEAQGWLDQYGFAGLFEHPDDVFGDLSDDSFRRAAVASWEQGKSATEVQLIQFRDAKSLGSRTFLKGQKSYMADSDWAGNDGRPIPGSSNGRVYVFDRPDRKPGYLPLYRARALAARGDIVMDIWFYDTKPISKKTAMALAERQLERL